MATTPNGLAIGLATGAVGMGTTFPLADLHVVGNTLVSNTLTSSNVQSCNVYAQQGTYLTLVVDAINGEVYPGSLWLSCNQCAYNTARMHTVGIGTTLARSLLHVEGDAFVRCNLEASNLLSSYAQVGSLQCARMDVQSHLMASNVVFLTGSCTNMVGQTVTTRQLNVTEDLYVHGNLWFGPIHTLAASNLTVYKQFLGNDVSLSNLVSSNTILTPWLLASNLLATNLSASNEITTPWLFASNLVTSNLTTSNTIQTPWLFASNVDTSSLSASNTIQTPWLYASNVETSNLSASNAMTTCWLFASNVDTSNLSASNAHITQDLTTSNIYTYGNIGIGTTTATRILSLGSYGAGFDVPLGGCPLYGVRAWVTFDGTTTPPTMFASGNVLSLFKNGSGDYTCTFQTPLPHGNYALLANAAGGTGTTAEDRIRSVGLHMASDNAPSLKTDTQCRVLAVDISTQTAIDPSFVSLLFLG